MKKRNAFRICAPQTALILALGGQSCFAGLHRQASSFPIRPALGTIWMGVPLLLTPPRGNAPRLVSHARDGATPQTGLRCSLFEVCFITPLEG
jgi:hypothetical protein